MSKVEFYANKGARYKPYVYIIGQIKTDSSLRQKVNDETHNLNDDSFPHEDLCWELAEYQLIFEKGFRKYTETEINKRAKRILDSKLSYYDICWLISSFKIYLKENKIYP